MKAKRKEIRVYTADDIPLLFLSCFLTNIDIHRNPICKTRQDTRETLKREGLLI